MLEQHLEFPLHSPIFLVHLAGDKNKQKLGHEHGTSTSINWHKSIQLHGAALIYIDRRAGLKVYGSNGNGRISAVEER